MAYDKTASAKRCTVDEATRDAILAKGVYGHKWFTAIWGTGETTNTGAPTLATMVQNYDLSTQADIEAALDATGVRGWECNEIMAGTDTPV
jgi:hypothetical protein